jgi:Histidine kinase
MLAASSPPRATATAPVAQPEPIGRKLFRHGVLSLGFNTVIAAVLSVAGRDSFLQNMVYSQLIGISIWLLIDVGRHLIHPQGLLTAKLAAVMTLSGGLVGYFVGSSLGDWVLGHPVLSGWRTAPNAMAGFLLMSLLAATTGVYFFMSREMLASERGKAELAQRQATEAQLKLLQSQLDPHMLFNTLANLRVLIQQDPDRAVQMLDQLNDFLRASLAASRSSEHALQAEFDRLRDYLSLMQTRMGKRLDFSLELPPGLANIPVPTLILQSLVENAVLHGLEPKVEGGRVVVKAFLAAHQLVLQITDDGLGLGLESQPLREGFGITQVRERLKSRYGDEATIEFIALGADSTRANSQNSLKNEASVLSPEPATGCQVTLRLPLPD